MLLCCIINASWYRISKPTIENSVHVIENLSNLTLAKNPAKQKKTLN